MPRSRYPAAISRGWPAIERPTRVPMSLGPKRKTLPCVSSFVPAIARMTRRINCSVSQGRSAVQCVNWSLSNLVPSRRLGRWMPMPAYKHDAMTQCWAHAMSRRSTDA